MKGYLVGGKTGTSEDGVNTNKYITSFIGVAPISDPEVVALVTLYNPTGEGGHQGGGVAAPVGGQILSEVLQYLELQKDGEDSEEEELQVEVPDIRDKKVGEVRRELKELGLELKVNQETEENIDERNIINQVPLPGIKVNIGSQIYVDI